jgi:hypothetical protein
MDSRTKEEILELLFRCNEEPANLGLWQEFRRVLGRYTDKGPVVRIVERYAERLASREAEADVVCLRNLIRNLGYVFCYAGRTHSRSVLHLWERGKRRTPCGHPDEVLTVARRGFEVDPLCPRCLYEIEEEVSTSDFAKLRGHRENLIRKRGG